jgi:hypothetical protein
MIWEEFEVSGDKARIEIEEGCLVQTALHCRSAGYTVVVGH